MIDHISIGVHDTKKAADVLAELWGGYAMPFPVAKDSWMVFADDGIGTAVEVTPINTLLVPGEGHPEEEGFSIATPTEEFEAKFVTGDFSPAYVTTQLNINTKLNVQK